MTDDPTVLLVDDEEDVVEIYALALAEDYEVRKAYDGEEALAKLDGDVDVVLLDRRMPGMPGGEVLEAIRSAGYDVRVGMVTAVDPDFDIAAMDFDAYLTKPVHDPEIRAVVEELLALAAYDQRVRDLFSVVEKKAILETEKTEQELAASDEYARLTRREHDLEAVLEDGRDDMDDATFRKVFSGLSDPGTDRS